MKPSCRACLLSGVSSQEGRICNGCILDYGLQAEKPGSCKKKKNDIVDSTVFPPLLYICVPQNKMWLKYSACLRNAPKRNVTSCFFFRHRYSWVIKATHRLSPNNSGHMDLNSADKVSLMFSVQTWARWSKTDDYSNSKHGPLICSPLLCAHSPKSP